ncbi:MAG: Trm112 family protein [Candidatus Aceula meridiana]|nr:Trm112 family protein [Candidatus Aceula meridiana]
MTVDAKLLKILTCLTCHGPVEDNETKIVCTSCGRQYPIKDGIPVMMPQSESKDF